MWTFWCSWCQFNDLIWNMGKGKRVITLPIQLLHIYLLEIFRGWFDAEQTPRCAAPRSHLYCINTSSHWSQFPARLLAVVPTILAPDWVSRSINLCHPLLKHPEPAIREGRRRGREITPAPRQRNDVTDMSYNSLFTFGSQSLPPISLSSLICKFKS